MRLSLSPGEFEIHLHTKLEIDISPSVAQLQCVYERAQNDIECNDKIY